MDKPFSIEDVASICHEANRALCLAKGDNSQTAWESAPDWQQTSAVNGVNFHLQNPNADASASHNAWKEEKHMNGWVYGIEKDPELLTHPCMVEFDELPLEQQAKDHLFKAIVKSLEPFMGRE